MSRSVRVRPLSVLAAVVAVLLGLTACTTTVSGTGRAVQRPVADVTTATQLAGLLMTPPDGSEPGTSDWAKKRTPSIQDLAEQTYKDPDSGADILKGYGIQGIAHVVWTAEDGRGADMTLLLFDSNAKATTWKKEEVDAFGTEGLKRRTLDAGQDTVGFSFDPDDDKVTDTRFHTVSGKVGVLMDYFTSDTYDDADAETWLKQQYARLG